MNRGRTELLKRCAMLGCTVAFVPGEAIARPLIVQSDHQPIAVHFGDAKRHAHMMKRRMSNRLVNIEIPPYIRELMEFL